MKTDYVPIHPVGKTTTSVSPYDRKLADVAKQLQLVLSVAPEGDRPNLLLASDILAELLKQKEKRNA